MEVFEWDILTTFFKRNTQNIKFPILSSYSYINKEVDREEKWKRDISVESWSRLLHRDIQRRRQSAEKHIVLFVKKDQKCKYIYFSILNIDCCLKLKLNVW